MSEAQDVPARTQNRIFDAVLAELAEVGIDEFSSRDGFTGTLRVVDDQVAAEAELAEVRRRREAADQEIRPR